MPDKSSSPTASVVIPVTEGYETAPEKLEREARRLESIYEAAAKKAPSLHHLGGDAVDALFRARNFREAASWLREPQNSLMSVAPGTLTDLAPMMKFLSEMGFDLPCGGPLYLESIPSGRDRNRYRVSLTNVYLPVTDKPGFPAGGRVGTIYPLDKAIGFLCRVYEFMRTPPSAKEIRAFRTRFIKDKSKLERDRMGMENFLESLLVLGEWGWASHLTEACAAYDRLDACTRDALPARFLLPIRYAEQKAV